MDYKNSIRNRNIFKLYYQSLIMMFNYFSKKEFLKYIEDLERTSLYFSKNPIQHKKIIGTLTTEFEDIIFNLNRIYESYGCDIATSQNLLSFLKEYSKKIRYMINKSEDLNQEIKNFLKIIEKIIDKNEYLFRLPGKGIKGKYIKFTRLIEETKINSNKINLEVIKNKLYRDGKEIQGLIYDNEYITFLGYHFTNKKSANFIKANNELLINNFEDPYIYLLEARSYTGLNEKEIRHQIGSNSATDVIIAKIKFDIHKVWIKVEKNRPTHFALEDDVSIRNLIKRKGDYLLHKTIKDL